MVYPLPLLYSPNANDVSLCCDTVFSQDILLYSSRRKIFIDDIQNVVYHEDPMVNTSVNVSLEMLVAKCDNLRTSQF